MSKSRLRIIKRTKPNGSIVYVVQKNHFIFRRYWYDFFTYSGQVWNDDEYNSLEEAEKDLIYFDGSKSTDEVIFLPCVKEVEV